jgi:hypothetical protein
VPRPIARWNPARDVWETQTTGLFCEHSDVWSETWPPSGMWDGGTVYALPTSEHRMADSESSSLLGTPRIDVGGTKSEQGYAAAAAKSRLEGQVAQLPTPTSRDWKDGACADADVPTNGLLGRTVVRELLPTPRTSDTNGAGQHGQGGLDLRTAVELLPTPTAQAGKHSADDRGPGTLDDCNLWSVAARLGASTNPRFAAGNTSSDDPPPHPPN